jgi:hypothetical protein
MTPDPKWPYPLRPDPRFPEAPGCWSWDLRNLTVMDRGSISENDEHRVAYLWGVAGIRPIGMSMARAQGITDRVLAAECPLLDEFMGRKTPC